MDQEQQDVQQPRWQPPTRRQLLWAGAALALLTLLAISIRIGYHHDITLWDWLELLVVPAVIAGGGIWFNRQQRERELEIAAQQREQDLTIAAQQREQELEIAERRTQDEALQAYLDQMSGMLIPNTDQPSLYKARPGDSLSSVARARTLTVLLRLDGERKARVVQFLHESGLIVKGRPVLDLQGADLTRAKLTSANLNGADMSGVDLSDANLVEAKLVGANLRLANLLRASLTGAHLSGADLTRAKLVGTNLHEADMDGADLSRARVILVNLTRANLLGATIDPFPMGMDLRGATMPNGQKYEDWIKDKESRKQNE